MKYLYIYNYFAPYEENMCHEEFKTFFHDNFKTKYYLSDQDIPFKHSVFIKERLTILACATAMTRLIRDIATLKLISEDFRISYIKNKITHVDYQESLRYCQRIAEVIGGETNLKKPKHVFGLTKINDSFYFGILERNMDWHEHVYKPYSYSHSLPVRIARTALNLGIGTRNDLSIIDPCCGVATVVIEGLAMGLNIIGSDISRDVSYKGRLNVQYYGFDPMRVTRKDIHDIQDHYDVAILDVPYGIYAPVSASYQLDLIHEACRISDQAVVITHVEYDKEFIEAGKEIRHKCFYKKSNFYRFLYVLGGDRG